MIKYITEHLTLPEASRVKAWIRSSDADLFKQCVEAEMNHLYMDAINKQSTDGDPEKFNSQAKTILEKAHNLQIFMRVMSDFASETHGLYRIKLG